VAVVAPEPPETLAQLPPLLTLTSHWYVRPEPVAAMENVAVEPALMLVVAGVAPLVMPAGVQPPAGVTSAQVRPIRTSSRYCTEASATKPAT
jgi:hypothetical protein